MADIDHVFSGFRQSIDGSFNGSSDHGINNNNMKVSQKLAHSDSDQKVLPAITGLPLPPTPEVPGNLPPVLGSPMTTASNVSNSSPDHSDGSEIYHNITTAQKSVSVSHRPTIVRHSSNVNSISHKPIQQKMSLQHHPHHYTNNNNNNNI